MPGSRSRPGWKITTGSDNTRLSVTQHRRRSPPNWIGNGLLRYGLRVPLHSPLLQSRLCPKQPSGSNPSWEKLGVTSRGKRPSSLLLIMPKVPARTLGRQDQGRHRDSLPDSTPVAALAPDPQSFFAVELLGLLAVDHRGLPAKQNVEPTLTDSTPPVGQLAPLLSEFGIVLPRGMLTHALAISIIMTQGARHSVTPLQP